MKRWNTIPNWLTLFRVLLIPVFSVFFLRARFAGAALVFLLASLTDYLDGQIARRTGQVTEFGIFFDQFADKLLVWTALILFLFQSLFRISAFWVVLIVVRDLSMLAIRGFVKRRTGAAMKTSLWGKAKSAVQMASIVFILAVLSLQDSGWTPAVRILDLGLPAILIVLSALLAVFSWLVYITDNRAVLRDGWRRRR